MHCLRLHCLLSCLSVRVVFWHDALSFGSWETRNISTSLCQTPAASQDEALWWPIWQWQTDNDWMLHFTSLTFFLRMHLLSRIVCWAGEKEDKGWLRGRKKKPSKDILHEDTQVSAADMPPEVCTILNEKWFSTYGWQGLSVQSLHVLSMFVSAWLPLSVHMHLRLVVCVLWKCIFYLKLSVVQERQKT